jgi:pyruvate/2-oxoglutarate dehydrogenase complex dihydrolipoamide acyltransferase (E2) component
MNDLSAPPPSKADPAVYGEGLARVLDAVAERMPKADVASVWSFPGVRRDGREYGVAVVLRRGVGDRHVVYRARYVLQEKGQERGKIAVELEATAEAPADLLPRVIDGVRERADEAGDADVVDLTPWKAEGGEPGAE